MALSKFRIFEQRKISWRILTLLSPFNTVFLSGFLTKTHYLLLEGKSKCHLYLLPILFTSLATCSKLTIWGCLDLEWTRTQFLPLKKKPCTMDAFFRQNCTLHVCNQEIFFTLTSSFEIMQGRNFGYRSDCKNISLILSRLNSLV